MLGFTKGNATMVRKLPDTGKDCIESFAVIRSSRRAELASRGMTLEFEMCPVQAIIQKLVKSTSRRVKNFKIRTWIVRWVNAILLKKRVQQKPDISVHVTELIDADD